MRKENKKMNKINWEEELYCALSNLVDELNEWEVPQVDKKGNFSEETALGYANKIIEKYRKEK